MRGVPAELVECLRIAQIREESSLAAVSAPRTQGHDREAPSQLPRTARAARARSLRDQGRALREIAEEMGVATSTVRAWLFDPDGSKLKARKRRYASRCIDCGALTSGGAGRGPNAPKRCKACGERESGDRERERARGRRALIEQLWAAGETGPAIAAQVGWKGNPSKTCPCCVSAATPCRIGSRPARRARSPPNLVPVSGGRPTLKDAVAQLGLPTCRPPSWLSVEAMPSARSESPAAQS